MRVATDGGDEGIVGRYLAAVTSHRWADLESCLAEDVVRVGPYGDTYEGRPGYVRFLSELMPTLPGYSMAVTRISYGPDGASAVAELSETVEMEGKPHVTPEALVFDLDGDGLISHISIYIQRPGERPRTPG